jgi:hypothetical protein
MRSSTVCAPLWRAALLLGCFVGGNQARSEWVDQQTVDVFHVRSEFSLADGEGQMLLAEIRELRNDVEQLLGLKADADPIEVNLFATRRSYQQYLSVRVPDGMNRAALFVKGADRGRVYVYRHRDFLTDVRHECTHAVLHNALPYVPLWLDEGLAEYFEVPAPLRAGSNPHFKSLKWAVRLRWSPPLAGLEDKRELAEMDANDYRDSWAWVHYLLHGPLESRQVLSNYLYDVRMGNPAGQLSERLSANVPSVQSQLVEHFRTWKTGGR